MTHASDAELQPLIWSVTACIKCKEHQSNAHITALHPEPSSKTSTKGGPEALQPAVTLKCTEVHRDDRSSMSCSKICLCKS